MGNLLIKAESVSKCYRIGLLGASTAKEDLRNWWFRKSISNQTLPSNPYQPSNAHIWALRDISFELGRGEVLGLLGKNGSGKSTLLKIISRITLPSSGRILGNGRTASLLEAGTGFHQELSARENIYLNGHILGMKKKMIDSRFDEIVDFSGVEQFLDTPVKRFSTGMYLRLAFAVAAHLQPDLLIVDEVLAVGDDEFQKKCMNKMMELSSLQGMSILFVSHNLNAIRNLCSRVMLLKHGALADIGDPNKVISGWQGEMNPKKMPAELHY
jgi:lipopolysaccharide transport system ATP-binding protein